MTSQKFGGPWSLLKLQTLESYLKPFCTALSGRFKLLYIDAFAGSGSFSFRELSAAPLFDEDEQIRRVHGSARIALQCSPSFDQLIFIEEKTRNILSLKSLASEYPRRNIIVLQGDANEKVSESCTRENWQNTRGVIFLDPFGNSVEWRTLEKVAQTRALDVWYLFPLSGVYRQAPVDQKKLTEEKRASITRILGTDAWEEHFYKPIFDETDDLFGPATKAAHRTLKANGILSYVARRLETLFPYVAPPRILYGPSNAPMYALFLALSNKSEKAIALAKRISLND